MAFKKVLLLSLLVTVASVISLSDASDRERPPRTLSWFSSSSSASQVKTEQPSSPQVQTPLPTVVPTVSTQSLRLPYVYSVRYYSDLSPQDRSKDQVLVGQLEGGAQDARGAPCPYDQAIRVAGIGASPAPPNERIAGYSYQYQTPTVVAPSSPTVTLTQQSQLPSLQAGPVPQQTGQSGGSSPIVPMVHLPHHHHHEHEHDHDHHEHPPMVLPVPVMAPPQLQQSQSSQIQQIPGSLLPFLQAAAAVATSSPHSHQHQGVVLPIYTVPQVAHSALMTTPPQHQQQPRPQLHEYQPHQILHQQLHQHQQHQQHQQYQQKVVPSVVGDYPYYYLYPEFVYVVPVLQPPQTSASSPTTQQLQQGVPFQLTQRHQQQQQHQQVQQQPHHQQQQQQQQQHTQHQTTMSVSGQHPTSDEVRQHQQQHHPQQQQQQQQQQSRQQTKQKQ